MAKKIILASSSPRRKLLLEQWGVPFEIMPCSLGEENINFPGEPGIKVEKLALMKALDVAQRTENSLILGADTIVVLDGLILGKPVNDEDAYSMLGKLSGKCHEVLTGVAMVDSEKGIFKTGHEKTKVYFREISDKEIREYIYTGEPKDKAGAYAIQGKGALFVEKIDGSYTNVVGLPYELVQSMLKEFGIII
ncbi:MAG: septum formation inhibitor Maf [Clostridiaceae bacterium]|nr:septum formation inhibitor Maf [Clostridiaceae bacterium]